MHAAVLCKVDVATGAHGTRGLRSNHPCKAGDTLLEIPAALMLTPASAVSLLQAEDGHSRGAADPGCCNANGNFFSPHKT